MSEHDYPECVHELLRYIEENRVDPPDIPVQLSKLRGVCVDNIPEPLRNDALEIPWNVNWSDWCCCD